MHEIAAGFYVEARKVGWNYPKFFQTYEKEIISG
jgi:hypothetical protein